MNIFGSSKPRVKRKANALGRKYGYKVVVARGATQQFYSLTEAKMFYNSQAAKGRNVKIYQKKSGRYVSCSCKKSNGLLV